jgi:mannose-6-phosphate isomerase-like protein (cupin superfamily)
MNLDKFDINKHKFLGKVDYPLVTWDEVIFNLNKNVISNGHIRVLNNLGFVTHNAENIEKVNYVNKVFQELFPSNHVTAHLYFSLTEISQTLGKHVDHESVFFWQCIGTTKWTVYEDDEYNYDLMPGEILYIPKGVYHNTHPVTPRAGISFGLE